MSKWLGRGIVAIFLAFAAFSGWSFFRFGLHKQPIVPEGAFWLSYSSGFRGIVVELEDARPNRAYIAYSAEDVPPWFQKTWSTCRPLTEDERTVFEAEADRGPGHRWEAVCEIDADGVTVVRGWIASVPNE